MPLPIERPGKVISIGLNYKDHAAEGGFPIPEIPLMFGTFSNALIGNGEPIVLHEGVEEVDYEAELGVVIGSEVRGVSVENALEAVKGYLCFNDISARVFQRSDFQMTRSKSLDTFSPIGPELVPASEVGDPQNLQIRCILNGEVLQDENTSQMIFPVAELISWTSQYITLEPGDLIATGTPAGVGSARSPKISLKPGDEVSVEIEKIGTLTNPVVAP